MLMLAACSRPGITTIAVDISLAAGSKAPATLQVSVYDRFGALALSRAYPSPLLPGRLILEPPDVDQELRIALNDAVPPSLQAAARVTVHVFARQQLSMVLAPPIDADGDGVADAIDNCPNVINGEQKDQDGNGTGDACQAPSSDLGIGDGAFDLGGRVCAPVIVSSYAGDGTAGDGNGPGLTAQFRSPAGLAIDKSTGTLYVSELAGNRVRAILGTPTADTSTFAGSGTAGYMDGAPGTARFNQPAGLAFDPTVAEVLVADQGNAVIRVIDGPNGVGTLTGTGATGYQEGPYNVAQFNAPSSLALDGVPNLYAGDEGNFRIRHVNMNGDTSPFVGDGTNAYKEGAGIAAELSRPLGLCWDGVSRLLLADAGNHRIRSIDSAGNSALVAGSGAAGNADGPNAQATFTAPSNVTVDAAGDVFITDTTSNLVRRISLATGRTDTLAGTGQATPFSDGRSGCDVTFNGPRGIVAGANRTLYVADTGNQRIRRIQY